LTYYARDTLQNPPAKIEEFRSGNRDQNVVDMQSPVTGPIDVYGVANMADPDVEDTGYSSYWYELILYRADADYLKVVQKNDDSYALASDSDHVVLASGDRCNQRILCGVVSHFFLAEARVSSILASAFFFFLQSKHKELLL
jgi:hypothetical protein